MSDAASPTTRDKIYAVTILLLAGIAAWQLLLNPMIEAFSEKSAEIQRSRRLLQDLQARATAHDRIKAELEALRQNQRREPGYMEGANAAVASTSLQGAARRLLDAAGATLRSLQTLPPSVDGATQRIAVRVDATVPAHRLLDLLYAVRSSSPYLFVDSVDMRVPESQQAQPNATARPDIVLRADLYAFIRSVP